MKRLTSLLAIGVLATGLSAEPVFLNQNFDDDFAKMQNYINSMMNSKFSGKYFSDVSFPKINMSETKESYILKFDVAGIAKEDLKLSIGEDNILTIEGERKSETKEKEKSFSREEIFYGKFQRSIKLPPNANQNKLDTKYDNGILSVTIAKKVIDKPATKII
jgi:HSP20 family protein